MTSVGNGRGCAIAARLSLVSHIAGHKVYDDMKQRSPPKHEA
ncbi:MAG: hypothetical protein V7K68_25355 [Nostoc sp.]